MQIGIRIFLSTKTAPHPAMAPLYRYREISLFLPYDLLLDALFLSVLQSFLLHFEDVLFLCNGSFGFITLFSEEGVSIHAAEVGEVVRADIFFGSRGFIFQFAGDKGDEVPFLSVD
jgi:hypothetical protein